MTLSPTDRYQQLIERYSIIDPVRLQLAQMLSVIPPDNMERSGLRYEGPMGFILEHGVIMPSPVSLPSRYPQMQPRFCFTNATHLMLERRLVYVEGYAQSHFLAVPHAWCLDRFGTVIDPTWQEFAKGKPRSEWSYVGVPFTRRFVLESLMRTQNYGVIDQWEHGFPTLQRRLPKWAVVDRYRPHVFR